MQYLLFTDNLSDLSLERVCSESTRAGFDGIDLTLRPGGHVLPENAEMGLSQAGQIADRAKVVIPLASTAIIDTSSSHAEDIFASCAHYGIRRIKLGYWRYRPFGTLVTQIEEARARLKRLVSLGKKYNVLPCVHVHSGYVLANGGTALYLLLKDFDPSDVGAYVDPMHMTIEGSLAGWEMGLDLLAPWVAVVGMKNFRWQEQGRDKHGQMRYRWEYVPLADGQAPLPQFMSRLKELKYDGIISLHSEYKGQSSFRVLTTAELLRQSAEDLKYVKTLI